MIHIIHSSLIFLWLPYIYIYLKRNTIYLKTRLRSFFINASLDTISMPSVTKFGFLNSPTCLIVNSSIVALKRRLFHCVTSCRRKSYHQFATINYLELYTVYSHVCQVAAGALHKFRRNSDFGRRTVQWPSCLNCSGHLGLRWGIFRVDRYAYANQYNVQFAFNSK